MTTLLDFIKRGNILPRWSNKKSGCFEYNTNNIWYQFIECTTDIGEWIIPLTQRNTDNCPIMAQGFIAYLIRYLGANETDLYSTYYKYLLHVYKEIEGKKAGAFKRDLDAEFYVKHIQEENERVKQSQGILEFVTEEEGNSINNFVNSYFEYILQFKPSNNLNPPVITLPETYAQLAIETRHKEFLDSVSRYCFLSLDLIKALTDNNKARLIGMILKNKTPYAIAMLKHLGYIDKLSADYNLNNTQICEHLAHALECNDRTVKGNIAALNPISRTDRARYTANNFVEQVRKDYKNLTK